MALLINKHFVPIKVDREERPDIDQLYMTACQLMTGGGGWPLTAMLTPEGEPFFVATYIPKQARFGRPGMLELIPRVGQLWQQQRGQLLADAGRVAHALQEISAHRDEGAAQLQRSDLESAARALAQRFDRQHGGFGTAPKFPTPHMLRFLLRHHLRSGDARPLQMVQQTLAAMRLGGIFDHLGYGFHRYSTDDRWLVPHFEKMLYDQAQLAMVYLEAYQLGDRDEQLAHTARQIFEYVDEILTDRGGAFYSAEDADSEGVEGKF